MSAIRTLARNGLLGNRSSLVAKCLSTKSAMAPEVVIGKRCGVSEDQSTLGPLALRFPRSALPVIRQESS